MCTARVFKADHLHHVPPAAYYHYALHGHIATWKRLRHAAAGGLDAARCRQTLEVVFCCAKKSLCHLAV